MFTIITSTINILQTVGFVRKAPHSEISSQDIKQSQWNGKEAFNKNCHTFMASQYENQEAI